MDFDKDLLPVEIGEHEHFDIPIMFEPTSADMSLGTLTVVSDAKEYETVIALQGLVVPTTVHEQLKQHGLEISLSPHPANGSSVISSSSTRMRSLEFGYADLQGVVHVKEQHVVGPGTTVVPVPDHLSAGRWT